MGKCKTWTLDWTVLMDRTDGLDCGLKFGLGFCVLNKGAGQGHTYKNCACFPGMDPCVASRSTADGDGRFILRDHYFIRFF